MNQQLKPVHHKSILSPRYELEDQTQRLDVHAARVVHIAEGWLAEAKAANRILKRTAINQPTT